MNGKNDVLTYVNSILVKLNHSVKGSRAEEIDDLCLALNLLYRVNYRLPFLINEKGEFLSDNLENIEDPVVNPLPEEFTMSNVFQLIGNTYQELSDIDHGIFIEIYADAIEDAFNRYLTIRSRHISVQPKELTQLVCTLIKEKGCRSVFNPFAGVASYTDFLKNEDYYCQDNNPIYRMIGRIRLDANHKDASRYDLGDSASEWNDHNSDCIVATFPHGDIIRPELGRKNYFEYIIDAFFQSNAKYAYLITTPSVCNDFRHDGIREYVTKRGLLEMVVLLPAGLFVSTGIPHCLIVLNKEKQDNNTLFVDASELAVRDKRRMVLNVSDTLNLIKNGAENKAKINIKNIYERNYQWNPRIYISDTDDHIPSGFEPVILTDILQLVHKTKNAVEKRGFVIHKADLDTDDMSFVKDLSMFSLSERPENTYRIDEPVLLISDIGKIKPLYIQASQDQPIFVNMGIYAYRLTNQWVDPAYLCLEISRKVQSLGISSVRTDLRLLEFTQIALPKDMSQKGLDEQRRIYKEVVDTAKLNKAKELGLLEIIENMKKDYINTVRNRKHDMKTPMTQLRNTLPLLKSLVDRVPDEVAQQLETYVERMETSMDKLSMIVSHLADEQVFASPEPVNLEEILSKEVTNTANYVVKYSCDETAFDLAEIKSPIVMMGKTDAVRLVQNIVDNAIKHGFDNPNQKYTLSINLTIEDDNYVIEFVNNGKPLPEGIDKESYGMNGVKSKGSSGWGTGGFVVKSITEHYGGDYDIFSRDSAGEILTYVIIKLPICLDNE